MSEAAVAGPADSLLATRGVRRLIGSIFGASSGLRAHLTRSAVAVFLLRAVSTGLAFATSVILVRALGVGGYGVYAYAMTLIAFLTIPATAGLPQLLMRSLAAYRTRADWNRVRGLLGWADRVVLSISIGLAGALAGVALVQPAGLSREASVTISLAALTLPLGAMLRLRQSMLVGFDRVVEGEIPEALVKPALFLALLGTALGIGWPISAPWAVAGQAAALAAVLLMTMWRVRRWLPRFAANAPTVHETRGWVQSAVPLLALGVLGVVNQYADVLLLGAMQGADAVGLYKVAVQTAALIAFALGSVNAAIGPTIAGLHASGEHARLQRVITRSARMALIASLPLVLLLTLAGRRVLALLFGIGFAQAAPALAILSVGQLVNVAMGPVGHVLIMTGHERDVAKGLTISAALNIALNVTFIPVWGVAGAALASAAALISLNVLVATWVHRKMGIDTTAWGRWLHGRPSTAHTAGG